MANKSKSTEDKKTAVTIMLPNRTIAKLMELLRTQGKDKNEWFRNLMGSILGVDTKKEEKGDGAKITPEALRALAEQMEEKEIKKGAKKVVEKTGAKTGRKAGRPPKGSGTKSKDEESPEGIANEDNPKTTEAKKKVKGGTKGKSMKKEVTTPAKKKVVAKKAVAKKVAVKKAPAKKTAPKKAPAKKVAPKKAVAKKVVKAPTTPSKATATVPVSAPTPKIEANKEAPVDNTATMGN